MLKGKFISFRIFNDIVLSFTNSKLITSDTRLMEPEQFDMIKNVLFTKKSGNTTFYSYDIIKIFLDKDIYNNIISLIDNKNLNYIRMDELISNHINSSEKVYTNSLKMLTVQYDRNLVDQFINSLKKYEDDRRRMSELLSIEGELPSIPPVINTFVGPKIKENLDTLRKMFQDINNNIESSKLISIKYNEILQQFNSICKICMSDYVPLKYIDENSSYHAILITNDINVKDIPILLNNQKKVLIPMNEHDYSKYSYEELEEISKVLDVYSNGNNKMDEIRSLIIKELARKNEI